MLPNQAAELAQTIGFGLLGILAQARDSAQARGIAPPWTHVVTERQWAALQRQIVNTHLSGRGVLVFRDPPTPTPPEVIGLAYLGTVVGVALYAAREETKSGH